MLNVLRDAVDGNVPFWILTIIAIFLLLGAAFTPPLFVIDSSIIAAVGELAGFGAIWCVIKALDNGTKATAKHGNTEITVHSKDDMEQQQTRGPWMK